MALERLERRFRDEVSKWQASHSTEEIPLFWELGFEISDSEFEQYVEQFNRLLRLRLRVNPAAESVLLFEILASRVSSAQLSCFWPQIAEEIGRMAGHHVCPEALAHRLRHCLEIAYRHQLERIDHAFRFVTLCFEESGTGLDRTVIVRSFFENLASRYPGSLKDEEREKFLQSIMESTEARHNGSNVEPLKNLMYSSGRELLDLIGSLRATPDIIEVALWEWHELREYWLRKTGRDLGRLMPEAREVFEAIMPTIGASLRRTEAARLTGQNGLKFLLPKCCASLTSIGSSNMPVGKMRLRRPDGSLRDIRILDDSGLSADRIADVEEACWHELNGHHLITRSRPFRVRPSLWRVEDSIPYFLGPHDSHGKPSGWLWSAPVDAARVPVDVESETAPEMDPKLSVRHAWIIRDGKLVLVVDGFSVLNNRFRGRSSLDVAGGVIWEGELHDGPVREPLRSYFSPDNVSDPEFVLKCERGRLAEAQLCHPLARGAAIFVNGRSRREREIRVGSAERLDIVVHPSLGRPEVTGASLSGTGSIEISGARYSRYGLEVSVLGQSGISIAAGRDRWNLRLGGLAELLPMSPNRLVYQGIRFSPIGAVLPVDPAQPLEIGILLPNDDIALVSDEDFLIVETMGRKLSFGLVKIDAEGVSNGVLHADLFDLVRGVGAEIPFGVSTVGLEGPHVNSDVTVTLFVVRGEVSILPSRLGDVPELEFTVGSQSLFRLRATQSTVADGDVSNPSARASIELAKYEALSVSWSPEIEDVVLFAGESVIPESDVRFNSEPKPLVLRRLGGYGSDLVARIGENLEVDFVDDMAGLNTGLQALIAEPDFASDTVQITVLSGADRSPDRSWSFDLTPVVNDLELVWDSKDGSTTLRIDYDISALPGQVVSFCLAGRHAGVDIEVDRAIGDKPRATTCIPCVPEGSSPPLRLKIEYLGSEIVELEVPQYQPPKGAHRALSTGKGVKQAIKALTGDTWKSTESNCLQLLMLYEKWCRLSPERQWPSDALLRRVMRREFDEVNRHLTAGLRLLECFHKNRDVVFDYSPPKDAGGLSVFLATLLVIEQLRNRKDGTMLPDRIDDAQEVFLMGYRKGNSAEWCECMLQVCSQLTGDVASANPDRRPAIRKCLESPLVAIDEGLLKILESMSKENAE